MGDVIAGLGIVFLFVEVLGLGVRAFAILNIVPRGVLARARISRRQASHDELATAGEAGRPDVRRQGGSPGRDDRALIVVAAFVAGKAARDAILLASFTITIAAAVHRAVGRTVAPDHHGRRQADDAATGPRG